NQPAPGPDSSDPIIVERPYGRGRVIVSTARLGNNRARLGHGAYRDLLAALVRRAAGEDPVVRVLGTHNNTELVLTAQGQVQVAHLVTGYPVLSLDLFGAPQPAAIEDVPKLSSLRLAVPEDTVSVSRVSGRGVVAMPIVDSVVEIIDLDDWETLVIARGDT
ncbi:MAG: hypothetical protein QOD50_1927, partial [Actinomycetota bacterium]|nr:hypothetical protein [Actinomycetota bacterium]